MPISIIDNFNLNSEIPLDGRTVVNNTSERNSISYKYDGLKVFQLDNRNTYIWNKGTNSWDLESLPYKEYVCILNQSGTSNPTSTVLKNTLGTASWVYVIPGVYYLNITGGFSGTSPRINGFCGPYTSTSVFFGQKLNSNSYEIRTLSSIGGTELNNCLNETLIEIKVW